MDRLSKRNFVIVCHEKVVRIPLEGDEMLWVHGERTHGVMKTLMKTKFRIDLVPEATSVAKSRYRLAPLEMQELSEQLRELQDKGFIRTSHFREEHYGRCVEEKGRMKPRRVRAMAMTIQYGVRGMILATQSEAFKQENGMMRTVVMDEAHASRYLVHPGADKMFYNLGDMYCLRYLSENEIESSWILSLNFQGQSRPFEILERIGLVADRLRLPEELSWVDKTLCFVEELVENSDREVKRLKCCRMVVVKFLFDELRDQVVNDVVTQLKVLTSLLDDRRGSGSWMFLFVWSGYAAMRTLLWAGKVVSNPNMQNEARSVPLWLFGVMNCFGASCGTEGDKIVDRLLNSRNRAGPAESGFYVFDPCLLAYVESPIDASSHFGLVIRVLSYLIVRNPWQFVDLPVSRGSFDVHFGNEEEHGVHLKLELELLRNEKLYDKVTYLRFIANFSKIVKPLTSLTERNQKYEVKLRRVRAMSMTIQSSVKDKILATSSETSKVENTLAEMLRDLDQQMEKRENDGVQARERTRRNTTWFRSTYGKKGRREFDVIWVMVDRLTKLAHFLAIQEISR
ncbi:hypothetical protein Tco_0667364, partial [Tanacetum coccineum]